MPVNMLSITHSPRIMIKFKNQKKQKSKSLILFVIGLVVGVYIGIELRKCVTKSLLRTFAREYFQKENWGLLKEPCNMNKEPLADLMLVGVLTAKEFVNTRMAAINEAWAKTIQGKVLFFSGEDSNFENGTDESLISLPGVHDTYPPQKKAFLMLKYMHDFYLNQFEWFIRADDDVYIQGDKLAKFLASVNSSKVYYIGQSGEGRENEQGKLGLFSDKTYCMGGPGVVMSRSTLAKVVSHISYCLKNLYSAHEDTEVGRCINQFADVSCTTAKEMKGLFYQNYKALQGSITPVGNEMEIEEALTLHPFKDHRYMYRMRQYLHQTNITWMNRHKQILTDDIIEMDKLIDGFAGNNTGQAREEILEWRLVKGKRYYTFGEIAKSRHTLKFERHQINKQILLLNQRIRANGKKENKNSYLKHTNYIFQTLNPIFGQKQMINVREHPESGKVEDKQYIMKQMFGDLDLDGRGNLHDEAAAGKSSERINFVIPLYGRKETFLRFIDQFEEAALKTNENVSLLVMFFRDGKNEDEYGELNEIFKRLQTKYTSYNINIIGLSGTFQRAIALQKSSSVYEKDALLFLVDIDCSIEPRLFHRIRHNTRQGKQAYFPIMFSQYDPELLKSPNRLRKNLNETFANDNGYWRMSSYGQVALYKSDFDAVGGFNTNIRGWGKEDTDFVGRILKKGLNVFRSTDDGLIHIYHTINCNPNLPREQYEMCLGTKWATFGSDQVLSDIVYNTPTIKGRHTT